MQFSKPIGLVPCYAGEQVILGGGESEGNPDPVHSALEVPVYQA